MGKYDLWEVYKKAFKQKDRGEDMSPLQAVADFALKQAIPEGHVVVPVEPTKEMWKAVNKLDDEMAAGGYDGKGCSIEQAWDCLIEASQKEKTNEQD